MNIMSSRVLQHQSSAFESRVRKAVDSPSQKRVLTRDDSGIFSSSPVPSPLTPSRTLSVFPLPNPTPPEVMNANGNAYRDPKRSSSSSGRPSPSAVHRGQANGGPDTARRTVIQPSSGGERVQASSLEEPLYLAFSCRSSCGPERWAYCDHTHCTNIRNQWQHLNTCTTKVATNQSCEECQDFQRSVLLHSAHCQDDNCIVTLCADAKRKLAVHLDKNAPVRNGHNHPPKILRSNSLRPFKHTQFIPQTTGQGSFDDMATSPMSPEDYLQTLQELNQIGVGALPRHLRTTFRKKAEQIIREMESEEPLDELSPMESSQPPISVPPTQPSSKYPVPTGVLSPIEEHPIPEEVEHPSQIILHCLEPDFLTQGRDGRYLHRRDYDLNEHLGSGGFGTCAAARDHTTDKLFVIKSNKFNDDKMINSLRSECDILARIPQHENITRFLGAILEEEALSQDGFSRNCRLMMELAEHGSLASMLVDEEGGLEPLPLDQSLFYLQQILQGLYHLHSCSIVHLDIKAENILVLEGGRRVKLTDFGTAAHIDEIAGTLSKLAGLTAHFTAPEIIRGEVPSFSCDIWSTVCVLIQLITAQLPGCFRHTMSRENMLYTVGNYTDKDIEQLIPLSDISEMAEDVSAIFYDTLREDPRSRPCALQLLSYPALVNACEYEQYFDIECTQVSEQEVEIQSEVGTSLESFHTPPTSLPHLITGHPGEDSDVSLDMPKKRSSQDSGVSTKYDRQLSEVFSVLDINDDSGIDTPGPENYPLYRQLNVNNMMKDMIAEDREAEERLTSIPDRSRSHPEVSLAISQYRQRSMSATYQRPAPVREGEGPHFGRTYPDVNESFFSLPTVTTTDLAALSRKARPNFVHLIHSNSAPMVMTEDGEGGRGRDHTAGGGFGENQNEVPKRLRRSSSEVYVDRGPDIDTPEEKKKKQELALAKQAEEQEQMVAMAARTVNKESDQLSVHSGNSPSSQHSHSSSSSGQSDHSSSSGTNGNYHHRYVGRQSGPNAAGNPSPYAQRRGLAGGYIQETLV